jgi:hypothetical protein
MTPVLSGGMVYEYSAEPNHFGLVTLNDDGSAALLADYETLQKQFNTLNITLIQGVPAQNASVTRMYLFPWLNSIAVLGTSKAVSEAKISEVAPEKALTVSKVFPHYYFLQC